MAGPLAGPFPGVSKIGDRLGGSLPLGAMQLFDKDPGAGWLVEDGLTSYARHLDGVLPYAALGTLEATFTPPFSSFEIREAIGVGRGSMIIRDRNGDAYTSTNGGLTWVRTWQAPSGMFSSEGQTKLLGNRFYSAHSSSLISSDDAGMTWSGPATNFPTNIKFLLFAEADIFIFLVDSRVYKSTDGGVSFSQIAIDVGISQSSYNQFRSVAYGNGVMWMVGHASTNLRSIDRGTTWAQYSTSQVLTVLFVGGRFVFHQGSGGYTTPDGISELINFTTPNVSGSFRMLEHEGLYLILASNAKFLHSSDLQNWTIVTAGFNSGNVVLNAAIERGRLFLMARLNSQSTAHGQTAPVLMAAPKLLRNPPRKVGQKLYTRIAA